MAIAFNGAANVNSGAGLSVVSGAYTVSASSNLLVASIFGDGTPITPHDFLTSVTYNSIPMTFITKNGISRWIYLYYLMNPPTGSNTLTANFSSACDFAGIDGLDYSGVLGLDQSNSGGTLGLVASFSLNVTSTVSNDWMIGYGAALSGSGNLSVTPNVVRAGPGGIVPFDSAGSIGAPQTYTVTGTSSAGNDGFELLLATFEPSSTTPPTLARIGV
jgi:hypothetical protein